MSVLGYISWSFEPDLSAIKDAHLISPNRGLQESPSSPFLNPIHLIVNNSLQVHKG